jgi:membrane-bound lytic murein transglycosylase D
MEKPMENDDRRREDPERHTPDEVRDESMYLNAAQPIGQQRPVTEDETGTSPARERAEGDSAPSLKTTLGRHRAAIALGVAASSLALVAGTRGGAGAEAEAETAGLLDTPAERAEKEGVSWDLPVADHERIDFFVEFLMGRNYDKTRLWLERLGRYAPFIQNELRERGMPEDLIWLATIESGLDNTAYSKAHASGMWQFISETGQRYGLEVSRYVDDRRDPIKATAAALTYLQQMHERFDSWYLASAGYNTGENRVGRLMRETTGSERGTDEGYWTIWDRLPRETRDYVPLMIAMGHIGKEPGKYGFHDLKPQEPLSFEEVEVPGGTRIADVGRAAGADPELMEELNARFLRGQTPPNRRMSVRVPIGTATQVVAALGGAESTRVAFGE